MMPAWHPEDVFAKEFVDSQLTLWHPTGLMYVAASLQEAGHEVKLADGAFLSRDEIRRVVKEFKPGFVGLYSNIPLWEKTKNIIEDVKEIDPSIVTAVGGPTAIGLRRQLYEKTDALDLIFTGEGEESAPKAIERLETGEDLSDVESLIFRRNGDVVENPIGSPIKDLDNLPYPSRELLGDLTKYIPAPSTYKRLPIATIISSRGCTNRCIYCFHIYDDRKIRYRSAKGIVDEIEYCVKKYGVKEIRFFDDNFCGNYDRVMEFCDLMDERKINISWYCNARVDFVDYKLMKRMKETGCWCILFGIESGVQKNLDMLRKNITIEQIKKSVKEAKKAGLEVYTPFIFGIPGETYEEAMKSIDLAIELDAHYVNFHTLAPFPGSELYDNVDKYGTMTGDENDYSFERAGFIPRTMTREEIFELRKKAFRKFYMRPSYILKRLLRSRSKEDLRTLLTGAKSLFYLAIKKDAFKFDE
jgi:radical SAM superfamily enzyme YgiQ (UPF0313 family)